MSIILLKDILTMEDRKEAYMLISRYYMSTSNNERQNIRSKWDFDLKWSYPDQSRLACCIGEYHSTKERIEASLVYYSIEDNKQNQRETFVGLALIYHSCLFSDLDPDELFEQVAKVSSERFASVLRQFLLRDPNDKSMEAFLLKSQKNVDGEWEIQPSWSFV